eukprot:750601-Hanusia_phi.AAC.2
MLAVEGGSFGVKTCSSSQVRGGWCDKAPVFSRRLLPPPSLLRYLLSLTSPTDLNLQDWIEWSQACTRAAEKFGITREQVRYPPLFLPPLSSLLSPPSSFPPSLTHTTRCSMCGRTTRCLKQARRLSSSPTSIPPRSSSSTRTSGAAPSTRSVHAQLSVFQELTSPLPSSPRRTLSRPKRSSSPTTTGNTRAAGTGWTPADGEVGGGAS